MLANRNQSAFDEFPFGGSDEECRLAAQRAASEFLGTRPFASDSISFKKVAYLVLSKDLRTRKRYFDAFVQEIAARKLDGPIEFEADPERDRELEDLGVLPRVMFVDDFTPSRWRTVLEELKSESDQVEWSEIPASNISEIKKMLIQRNDWDRWATDFLV